MQPMNIQICNLENVLFYNNAFKNRQIKISDKFCARLDMVAICLISLHKRFRKTNYGNDSFERNM